MTAKTPKTTKKVKKEALDATIEITDSLGDQLQKANITEAMVERMKEKMEPLITSPVKSKEDRQTVHAALMEVRDVRVAGEKIFDIITKERYRFWKESKDKEKEVLAPFRECEAALRDRRDEWDAQQELIRKQKAEAAQRIIDERREALGMLGFAFAAGQFVLEDTFIDAEQVDQSSHETWENLYRSLRMKSEEVTARKQKEAEELEELRKNKERLSAAIRAARQADIDKWGPIPVALDRGFQDLSDEEWTAIVQQMQDAQKQRAAQAEAEAKAHAERVEAQHKENERAALVASRYAELMAAGYDPDEAQQYSGLEGESYAAALQQAAQVKADRQARHDAMVREQEAQRLAAQQAREEEERKRQEEARQAALLVAGDGSIIDDYLDGLAKVPLPKVSSDRGKLIFQNIVDAMKAARREAQALRSEQNPYS